MLEAHGVQCLLVQHLAGAKQTILIAFLLGKLLFPKNLCWALGLNPWETHLLPSIPMGTCIRNLKKRDKWLKLSIPPICFFQNIFYLRSFPVKCNLIKFTKQGCFDPGNEVVISLLKPQDSAFVIISVLAGKHIFSPSAVKALALLQTNIFGKVHCKEQSRISQLLTPRKASHKQNKLYSLVYIFKDLNQRTVKHRYDKVSHIAVTN